MCVLRLCWVTGYLAFTTLISGRNLYEEKCVDGRMYTKDLKRFTDADKICKDVDVTYMFSNLLWVRKTLEMVCVDYGLYVCDEFGKIWLLKLCFSEEPERRKEPLTKLPTWLFTTRMTLLVFARDENIKILSFMELAS